MKETKLKVLEAYTRDVGRGVARIDYDTMDSLNLSTGSILEIEGKRKAVAKCLPLYPSDEGKNIIRYDSILRANSQSPIGATVGIKKVKASEALKITVSPIKDDTSTIDGRYLADALESVPVIKGDNVIVPYFGGRIDFKIIETEPNGIVIITQKTIFKIIETGMSETFIQYKAITEKRTELLKKELITSIQSKDYELITKTLEKFKQFEEELEMIKKILEDTNMKEVLKEENSPLNESLEEAINQWLEKKHKGKAEE